MKKFINIFALLFAAVQLNAQSTYDVIPIFNNDLTGTARFVGMGGAMSALGGDISVMSTNPAGIGIYRSNDLNASLSLGTLNTDSKFKGSSLVPVAGRPRLAGSVGCGRYHSRLERLRKKI